MTTTNQIEEYIGSQSEPKRTEFQTLHRMILSAMPGCRLWFSDGKNGDGKVVANPSVGYGLFVINYANGTSREFFQIGLSANKTGISIFIMGLKDKSYLPKTFGAAIGKATVTGYCIRFKNLKDIHMDVLLAAIHYGVETTAPR
jgi:hypothetical protein